MLQLILIYYLGACNINTGSTTTNYDNTLVAWAASAPPSGLIFQV